MGIGANIKNILDKKNIKQKEFAKAINETTVNVSRYLNEQRNIPAELYSTISEFLNMSIITKNILKLISILVII